MQCTTSTMCADTQWTTTNGHREKNRKKITIADAAKQQTRATHYVMVSSSFSSRLHLAHWIKELENERKSLYSFFFPLRITNEKRVWVEFSVKQSLSSSTTRRGVGHLHRIVSFLYFIQLHNISWRNGEWFLSLSEMGFLGFDFFFLLAHRTVRKWRKNHTHTHITVWMHKSRWNSSAREKIKGRSLRDWSG